METKKKKTCVELYGKRKKGSKSHFVTDLFFTLKRQIKNCRPSPYLNVFLTRICAIRDTITNENSLLGVFYHLF